MSTKLQKVEIVSTNAQISLDDNDDDKPCKLIAGNSSKTIPHYFEESLYFLEFLIDDSISTIPLFIKYFAVHECIVLSCGGLYHLNQDIGAVFLSILPGISIIGIFMHMLLTQFQSTFHNIKHYLIALTMFVIGACSIILIYEANTYLSLLVPIRLIPEQSSSTEMYISEILKFPHNYSMKRVKDATDTKQFNYRVSFVGSIIAPVIEESFKYLLLSLTFPISSLWSFSKATKKSSSSYFNYSVQSLFIIFIAVCGASGIATLENVGYLAACQWESTKGYCLPNRNFDILGAGLARGIFSVPFHCVTAGIMADIVCAWMNKDILNTNRYFYILKCILSYPLCIVLPAFLHSSFNYWMKGIPMVTGFFTIVGFSWLASRIAKKHAYIKEEIGKSKQELIMTMEKPAIDLTICKPQVAL